MLTKGFYFDVTEVHTLYMDINVRRLDNGNNIQKGVIVFKFVSKFVCGSFSIRLNHFILFSRFKLNPSSEQRNIGTLFT